MEVLKNFGTGLLVLFGIFIVVAILFTLLYFTLYYIIGGFIVGIVLTYLLKAIYGIGRDVRNYFGKRKKRCYYE